MKPEVEAIFNYLELTPNHLPSCMEENEKCTSEKTPSQNCVGIVLLKPDAIQSTLDPLIAAIIAKCGFGIIYRKWTQQLRDEQIETIYQKEQNKPWWPTLLNFMKSGPVMALVVIGCDAIDRLQKLKGNPNSGIRRMMTNKIPSLAQNEINLLLQGRHPQQNLLSMNICAATLLHVPEKEDLVANFESIFNKDELLTMRQTLSKFLGSIEIF